ncbi:uncharacterized protein si:ch73-95l15.5 isoform X2 [Clupea harengus]|uniref:Uncharacterized protein si:ch73-95l15.5 isoform X2 n=1 Tax=Clupea harengus TaxID=7950 RepID=A0A6P8GC07_CLUHA|nr:uncharacterized protein si:ch73-95l15.5 isoform X2 [Clupea harengus]
MMSNLNKHQGCRICGGDLQGNQRRWLYGGQKQRRGTPHTPTNPSSRSSVSGSALSSPWGSTLSLGSCSSPQTLSSPSKGVDLLSILTHILGQPVPKGSGQREFLCGKCASLLERVFKFDTVIKRVQLLSSERLQKLTQERDKIRQWVHNAYWQQHPSDSQEKEGLNEVEDEKAGYRSMLRSNLALSEYECWSERSNCCPYFQRTGSRCQKGKNCPGCNSLRVSDSDYESVCGIPRNLPFQAFSPLALSRDKSQSMPLHWSRGSSAAFSPISSAGSCRSLRYQSHADSLQSLNSLDGSDPFDRPETPTNLEIGTGQMNTLVKQLQEQLDQAQTCVRNLEAQLPNKPEASMKDTAGSNIPTMECLSPQSPWIDFGVENAPLQKLSHSLHDSVKLIQECVTLTTSLRVEMGPGFESADLLTTKMNKTLENIEVVIACLSELRAREQDMEREVAVLKLAAREREADLATLSAILQSNKDVINDAYLEMGPRRDVQRELHMEQAMLRLRDQILWAALQQREALALCQREALDSIPEGCTGSECTNKSHK